MSFVEGCYRIRLFSRQYHETLSLGHWVNFPLKTKNTQNQYNLGVNIKSLDVDNNYENGRWHCPEELEDGVIK
jgi:hypothetical protein